ncbi:hypothetical protein [Pseudomonas synxantha]|uniref:Uncharacterized protein n=1 Tax=Pseudomonas synxantha TaxID=47883 RepID=A0AAU8TSQ0_9PSED|nr:hypothetical protein [Pseudomonas synxantha]AKA85277.1 hypothetical protein VO64_4731 [Pseudomonas synxantha]
MMDLTLWQPDSQELLPASARTPAEISTYAVQLSARDRKQIVSAFDSGHYEMALNYLWGKATAALRKELSTVGVGLLGEMLGKADVDESDDVDDILTAKDTIKLAEELGIVTSTDGMRLRHTYEIITHFSQLDTSDSDVEEIDESEAISSLKACIKGVLGRPKVEVAKKFVDFREALDSETLSENDQRVEMLKGSPYFFNKLTISVLMSAVKKNTGANLDHTLANINTLIPAIWLNLRDAEKWQVGQTYAEAYADGKSTVVGGLKSALLKVKGFDYVPENLRSSTFLKAADAIIKAHEGLNNFYNETAPVRALSKLGSTIPTPALPACISALLCIVLGNRYGVSWNAAEEARNILGGVTSDRWNYYLNNVLPGDVRILEKLSLDRPTSNWCALTNQYDFFELDVKNKNVGLLVEASKKTDSARVKRFSSALIQEYYGKKI